MLDTQTETQRKTRGALQGKRIIILGAACAFGRSMVRALDAEGAQIVAIDSSATGLKKIGVPTSLHLRDAPEVGLRRIGRGWGETRLDAVLNLMPLRHPHEIDLNIATIQGLVQGFMPALSAREGQIITVVARPDQPLDVATGAMAPALVSVQAAYAQALKRDGLSLNLVNVGEGAVAPARTAVMGLLTRAVGPLTGGELRL